MGGRIRIISLYSEAKIGYQMSIYIYIYYATCFTAGFLFLFLEWDLYHTIRCEDRAGRQMLIWDVVMVIYDYWVTLFPLAVRFGDRDGGVRWSS